MLADELKKEGVGVDSKGQQIPALLYENDLVLLAENEMLSKELMILQEWCVKWAIKVNVGKCSVVHFRKRKVKRTYEKFSVNRERVNVSAHYKYLRPIISEHFDGKWMLEERAKPRVKACICAWLHRCRGNVGMLKCESFTKLLGISVESSCMG